MEKLNLFIAAYGSMAMFTLRDFVRISRNANLAEDERNTVLNVADEMCERYAAAVSEYQNYCRTKQSGKGVNVETHTLHTAAQLISLLATLKPDTPVVIQDPSTQEFVWHAIDHVDTIGELAVIHLVPTPYMT